MPERVVEHEVATLVALGHRRLGFLGDLASKHTERLLAAYWAAVDAGGVREGSVKHSKPLTVEELRRWAQDRRITAVLVEDAGSGSAAAALAETASVAGVRIPEDLVVVVVTGGAQR